jgi:hypothetical protein
MAATFNVMANTITVVNFETVPVHATGPNIFGYPEETITVPDVGTFSGGTVLGNEANLPAIIFATAPNTYDTIAGFDYSRNVDHQR